MRRYFLAALLLGTLTVSAAHVKQNGNIVTITPDGGQAKVVQLEVINANIIRVRATDRKSVV